MVQATQFTSIYSKKWYDMLDLSFWTRASSKIVKLLYSDVIKYETIIQDIATR